MTATNATGSAQAPVQITVNEGPPLTLTYASPVIYITNVTITPNTPTATGGGITSFSVTPPLPAGLTLHATTGVISGTPTVAQVATDHTVTGSNGAGFTQAVVNVRVDAVLVPPANLSYATPVSFPTGYAITNQNPTTNIALMRKGKKMTMPSGTSTRILARGYSST